MHSAPKAMEFKQIADFIPFYPALTDPDFSYNIARKKEFADYALTSDYTQIPGLFRQQVIIQRFLSPQTLYNELLIYHQVGAGKTATAFAVAEAWKTQDRKENSCGTLVGSREFKTPSQCPLIIVKYVDRFKPIFEQELKDRFPAYASSDATFAKNYEIQSHRTAGGRGTYSNRVIIIDEAHNLQPQKNKGEGDYNNLLAKLHTGVNSKKILLTGTPIPDRASQIIPLMNLILPDPIPDDARTEFNSLYFPNNKFTPQSTKVGDPRYDLTQRFKGRVSFFKTIIPSISQVKKGRRNVPILDKDNKIIAIGTETVPVVCNVMSNFQYKQANKSFLLSTLQRENAFSQTARRQATMVFKESETQDTNETIKKSILGMKDDLNVLKEYSATFHAILQDIKTHPQKLFFVYLDYVNGPGSQVNFGYVLNRFLGYGELGSRAPPESRKYAILGFKKEKTLSMVLQQTTLQQSKNLSFSKQPETLVQTETRSRKILDVFNGPKNIYGRNIHVLIGGQKSGEGITIKNVTRVHLIPYWNFAKSQQAIGRTIRPTSHNALIEALIRQKISLHFKDVELKFDPLLGVSRKFILKFPGDEKEPSGEDLRKSDFIVKRREGNTIVMEWTGTIKVSVFHHVAVGPPVSNEETEFESDLEADDDLDSDDLEADDLEADDLESDDGLDSEDLEFIESMIREEDEEEVKKFEELTPDEIPYRVTQDVRVFHRATEKYAKTAKVLEFLKRISFDCPLTYPRNMADGGAGANYLCYGFPEDKIDKQFPVWNYSIPSDQIEYDTYDLFYTNRKEIVKNLGFLFAENSVMSFRQILEQLNNRFSPPETRPNPLLGALQSMISQNYSLRNRFGFPCCLREDRDMYFLVDIRDAFRDDQKYEHAIYSALPFVTYQTSLQTLNDFHLLEPADTENIRKFCQTMDEEIFKKLSFQTRVRLLEEFYLKLNNKIVFSLFVEKLLKNDFYVMEDGVTVHIMFPKFHTDVGSKYKTIPKYTGEMRVLGEGGWRDAFPAEEKKYIDSIQSGATSHQHSGAPHPSRPISPEEEEKEEEKEEGEEEEEEEKEEGEEEEEEEEEEGEEEEKEDYSEDEGEEFSEDEGEFSEEEE